MVQQVRQYPGEISIYSAGSLTNVALAVRMDPTFASNCRELVIMGGYIDVNLLQVTGSTMQADWNSDIVSNHILLKILDSVADQRQEPYDRSRGN